MPIRSRRDREILVNGGDFTHPARWAPLRGGDFLDERYEIGSVDFIVIANI